MSDRVSVIIPAYKAQACISQAVQSVLKSGISEDRMEILISVDDGADYGWLCRLSPSVKILNVGMVASGPGMARNRALWEAAGDYIAFLDADDTWSDGYLETLLPLAATHGAAFSRTRILSNADPLLVVPGNRDVLTFDAMAESGASFWPVLHRDFTKPFLNAPSQDIFHAAEILSSVGGSAPLGGYYNLHLGEDSITRKSGFSARVEAAYKMYISLIETGMCSILPEHRDAALDLYRSKIALNDAFEAQSSQVSYYGFIAERMRAPEPVYV